ncbi:MAG TPA: glutamine--fructose-6-phosphate transaminase (isomerizing), partial [Nitrospiria bacterium]
MCGIIGYIGDKKSVPILIDGLRRLEYRGYDSAGVAYLENGQITVHRSAGKLSNLEGILDGKDPGSRIGIGHTRWATHGRPSEENAHPHRSGSLIIVHNGIIENYLALKKELVAEGRVFKSETDTEVIVHLIDRELSKGKGFEDAVRFSLKKLEGAYALCILNEKDPDHLIAARKGCPLVAGLGEGEWFIASDIPAILGHTRNMIFLEDGDMAILTRKGIQLKDLNGRKLQRKTETISWNPVMAERGGYKHFMLKEIHEQPQAILDTFRGRIYPETREVLLPEFGLKSVEIEGLKKITMVACGTSWHAAIVGKYLIEKLARIPVDVDIGSEFRYRDPILDKGSLLIAMSQSGETADTLAAMREARKKGARVASICNVVGSTMARESDGVLYTHAGPEIGVAATKTFTSQIMALVLMGLYLGRIRKQTRDNEMEELTDGILHLPHAIEDSLQGDDVILEIAKKYFKYRDFLFLGRGINYPLALEGALKLKELSYIHAEGYPSGEMKHGPIALIDENMPVVVLAPRDPVYEKVISNVMEVKARGGNIIAVAEEGNKEIENTTADIIRVPRVHSMLMPIILSIPMQLLAYHIAVLRGCDV